MFCTKCGKELNPGDRFCAHCGTEVKTEKAQFHRYEDVVFNPPFRMEAEKKTAQILRDREEYTGFAGFTEQEEAAGKKHESMDLSWNLDGFPKEKPRKTEEASFNWSAVLEGRTAKEAPGMLEIRGEKMSIEALEKEPIGRDAAAEPSEVKIERIVPETERTSDEEPEVSETFISIEELEKELFGDAPTEPVEGKTARYEPLKTALIDNSEDLDRYMDRVAERAETSGEVLIDGRSFEKFVNDRLEETDLESVAEPDIRGLDGFIDLPGEAEEKPFEGDRTIEAEPVGTRTAEKTVSGEILVSGLAVAGAASLAREKEFEKKADLFTIESEPQDLMTPEQEAVSEPMAEGGDRSEGGTPSENFENEISAYLEGIVKEAGIRAERELATLSGEAFSGEPEEDRRESSEEIVGTAPEDPAPERKADPASFSLDFLTEGTTPADDPGDPEAVLEDQKEPEPLEELMTGEPQDTDEEEIDRSRFYTFEMKNDEFRKLLEAEKKRLEEMGAEYRPKNWENEDHTPEEVPDVTEAEAAGLAAAVSDDEEEKGPENAEASEEQKRGIPEGEFRIPDEADPEDSDLSGEDGNSGSLGEDETNRAAELPEPPEEEPKFGPEDYRKEKSKEIEDFLNGVDDEKPRRHIFGKILIFLLVLLILCEGVVLGSKFLAPDSKVAAVSDQIMEKAVDSVIDLVDKIRGGNDEGGDQPVIEPGIDPVDESSVFWASLIADKASGTKTIGDVIYSEDSGLKYDAIAEPAFSAVTEAGNFEDFDLIVDEKGYITTCAECTVERIIGHFESWKDTNTDENLMGINKLEIGDVRQTEKDVYVLTRLTIATQDGKEQQKVQTVNLKIADQNMTIDSIKEETISE